MKNITLGLVAAAFAAFAGSAAAGDYGRQDLSYDGSDYAAKVYYRLDFGGAARHVQSLGFRLDSPYAEARGIPPAFQLSFGAAGISSVKIHGVELRGSAIASGETGNAFFDYLTPWEWVAVGVTAVATAVVVNHASNNNDTVTGSGSGA